MRLDAISLDLLKQSIEIYLSGAYPAPARARQPKLAFDEASSVKELVEQFEDESHYTEDVLSHRYCLRLGNRRYAHMKMVLEEFLVKGEYFFSVDSHDGMVKMAASSADYLPWQALQAANAATKLKIETAWQAAGIPTYKDLKDLMAGDAPTGAGGRARILVVDDEKDVVETTRSLLNVAGYDVDTAFDGYEALDKIAQNPPDVVLLDIMLPGMDGYEVCSKIKRDEKTRDIPVLLVTAGTGEMIATREANGFLVKPFRQKVLLSFIDHLLHPPAQSDEV